MYLSPAFRRRTDEELKFLGYLDGRTGFSLFWIDVIRPLLCHVRARDLLEIGAHDGALTELLVQYCESVGGNVAAVEPVESVSLRRLASRSPKLTLLMEKSETAIPKICSPVDAVFLEGDINYYTARNDVSAIDGLAKRTNTGFPIVFVKNTCWPYARRDMYYDPEGIPERERHEHARSGMSPWQAGLEAGMINYPFANSKEEGGPRNGILTAIQDFMNESALDLQLFSLPINHGLGILYSKGLSASEFIKMNLAPPENILQFLETCEIARINEIIRRIKHERGRPRLRFLGHIWKSASRLFLHSSR